MARPSKYTPERAQKIVQALQAGNTRRAACAYASISQDAFAAWLHRYTDFAEAIARAESEAEVRNVAIIQQAAQGGKHWQAAAWWLERRRHEDWREHKDVENSGEVNVKVIYANVGSDLDAPDATHSPAETDL